GDVDVVGHVLVEEAEVLVTEQMLDVREVAGQQVVHADDLAAVGDQPLTQVRSDEAGAAGDENSGQRFVHESSGGGKRSPASGSIRSTAPAPRSKRPPDHDADPPAGPA